MFIPKIGALEGSKCRDDISSPTDKARNVAPAHPPITSFVNPHVQILSSSSSSKPCQVFFGDVPCPCHCLSLKLSSHPTPTTAKGLLLTVPLLPPSYTLTQWVSLDMAVWRHLPLPGWKIQFKFYPLGIECLMTTFVSPPCHVISLFTWVLAPV